MTDIRKDNLALPATADTLHSALLACYLMITLIFLGMLFSWFVIDPLKYSILTGLNTGQPLKNAFLTAVGGHALRLGGLLAVIIGTAILLFRLEWRRGSLSAALQFLPDRHFYLLGFALLLWLIHSYLFPGHMLGGDAGSHIVRLVHFGRSLQEGKVPFWNNYFYMGCPFLQFYPPLFCWLGGTLYAVTNSADWSVKLLLLILHAGSGILFFLFLRIVGIGRLAALIGAISYAGAWAHGQLIWYQGVFPQALTMMLLPAAFLMSERVLHSDQPYNWSWTGLALVCAAMLLAHPSHGLFGGIYLCGYVMVRLLIERRRWLYWFAFATAGSLGIVIALFTIVPYLLEQDYVMASVGSGYFQLCHLNWEYFHHLLVWSNTSTTHGAESTAYVGLTVFLLASVAVASIRPWYHSRFLFAWTLLMLAALLVSMIWRGWAVRDIIFTLFFLSALAGVGTQRLLDRFPGSRSLPAMLLVLVFIDLGTTTLQPLPRTDKSFLDAAGAYLAAIAANERVMFTSTRTDGLAGTAIDADVGPNSGPITYYTVQTVGGPHNYTATRAHNFSVTIIKRAERELQQTHALSPDTQSLLAMLNVSRIVNATSRGMGLPAGFTGSVEEPPLGRIMAVPQAAPVLFAPELVEMPPPASLEKPVVWSGDYQGEPLSERTTELLEFVEQVRKAMRPIPAEKRADQIAVRALPANYQRSADVAATGQIKIDHYQVTTDKVELVVTTNRLGYLQLSHPWYPLLEVHHNGAVITPLKSALGLNVIPAVAGSNAIEIIPKRSVLRIMLGIIGWVGFVCTFLVPLLVKRFNARALPKVD